MGSASPVVVEVNEIREQAEEGRVAGNHRCVTSGTGWFERLAAINVTSPAPESFIQSE